MKTAVITGATGMIGIALAGLAAESGYRVFAVTHSGSRRKANIPTGDNITVIECDMNDYGQLPERIAHADLFFHLAWQGTFGSDRNNMPMQVCNIDAACFAAEAASALGCECFLFAGSQAEYGRVGDIPLSADTPTRPENGYGAAKLCAEQMTRIICRGLSMRHIACRILSVYGEYDGENTMIMSAVAKLLSGGSPQFTAGGQMWDYLYCGDAARALLLSAEKGKDGAVYPIGGGKARPLREYIELIGKAVGRDVSDCIGKLPYAENQVMYLAADISKLTADTGFIPETDFEDGIRRTVEWYKSKEV